MKFSRSLLEKHINFYSKYSSREIAENITQSGFEVEKIEEESEGYKNFIVAEIVESKKHPDVTKLNLCKVNTGKEILSIVCGGINANRIGLKVALALPEAIVPASGLIIKKTVIAGVESNGMICSAEELQLVNVSFPQPKNGILELPENACPGTQFSEFLNFNDTIFHISITPNRGDGASVLGIARELCAKKLGDLKTNLLQNFIFQENGQFRVQIEDSVKSVLKSVYYAQAEIGSNIPTDLHFEKKIWGTSGIPCVDIINYSMFMFGGPMHVYDYSKVEGEVKVRRSFQGEHFIPIIGEEQFLPEGLLIVADSRKVLSLLGIMGDKRSAADISTKRVLIESIHPESVEIIKSCKKTGFKSESSYRFERGIDYKLRKSILKHALHLMEVFNISFFAHENFPLPANVTFSEEDYINIIGSSISVERMKEILLKLEFKIIRENKGFLELEAPSFRSDISIKEDIAEEIARIEGFNNINPIEIRNLSSAFSKDNNFEIKKVLSEEMNEIITYSFFKENYFDIYENNGQKVRLQNPISSDLTVMRDSLIPNLLENISLNQCKGEKRAAIFEVGTIFEELFSNTHKINVAGAFSGFKAQASFLAKEEKFNIWHAKNKMTELLFRVYGIIETSLSFSPFIASAFHPKQSFKILLGKNIIGYLNSIHPTFLDKFGIKGEVFTFEITTHLLPLAKNKSKLYREKILFNVEREIAIIIPKKIQFSLILASIKKLKLVLLKEVAVKEVFENKDRIGENMKSLLLKFTIQQGEKTLTKDEIDNQIIKKIIEELAVSCQAIIRDGESSR